MCDKVELTIKQGATWETQLEWEIDGDLVNLTGYSAKMQLRRDYESAMPTIELTSGEGGAITLGGSLGTISIRLTATQTSNIPAGKYVFDLELTLLNGNTERLIEGTITVTREVTR